MKLTFCEKLNDTFVYCLVVGCDSIMFGTFYNVRFETFSFSNILLIQSLQNLANNIFEKI